MPDVQIAIVYGEGGTLPALPNSNLVEVHWKISETTLLENIEVRSPLGVVLRTYQRAKPTTAESNRALMLQQAESAIVTLQGYRAQSQPTLTVLWPMIKFMMQVQTKQLRLLIGKLDGTE